MNVHKSVLKARHSYIIGEHVNIQIPRSSLTSEYKYELHTYSQFRINCLVANKAAYSLIIQGNEVFSVTHTAYNSSI